MRWLAVGVWLVPLLVAVGAGLYLWRRLGPDRLAAFQMNGEVRWLSRQGLIASMLGWTPLAAIAAAFAPWYANAMMAAVAVVTVMRTAWVGLRETRSAAPPVVDPLDPRS